MATHTHTDEQKQAPGQQRHDPRPKLMEFELSAVSYLLFKETYSLLRDLCQSDKHMRLVSVC